MSADFNAWQTNCSTVYAEVHLPGVDDMLLSASITVGIQHQVTVSSIEVSVAGWVHRGFITSLHTPDLQTPDRVI